MAAVLGLDAPWTEHEPSGVALLSESKGAWRCVALAPSYEAFIKLACEGHLVDWAEPAQGSMPDPRALLGATKRLLKGQSVSVVTVDMPVSKQHIVGRREADNAVSKAFGNKGCAVHSPNPQRPGPMGERLASGFEDHAYSLAVGGTRNGASKHLVEVYPHPALLALVKADYRVPYKVNKTTKYWRGKNRLIRIQNILREHCRILNALRSQISEIALNLPECSQVETFSSLKRYEDVLDALVCAWVGIKFIDGKAKPYGDETAAIWIPE